MTLRISYFTTEGSLEWRILGHREHTFCHRQFFFFNKLYKRDQRKCSLRLPEGCLLNQNWRQLATLPHSHSSTTMLAIAWTITVAFTPAILPLPAPPLPVKSLIKVKEESEKVRLKLSTQKRKIMASTPITSWRIDGEIMETVRDFVSLGFTYGCEIWTIKKSECWRIDAFELCCLRRLLRVPWTARRSNQSILKEISLNIYWKDWC